MCFLSLGCSLSAHFGVCILLLVVVGGCLHLYFGVEKTASGIVAVGPAQGKSQQAQKMSP